MAYKVKGVRQANRGVAIYARSIGCSVRVRCDHGVGRKNLRAAGWTRSDGVASVELWSSPAGKICARPSGDGEWWLHEDSGREPDGVRMLRLGMKLFGSEFLGDVVVAPLGLRVVLDDVGAGVRVPGARLNFRLSPPDEEPERRTICGFETELSISGSRRLASKPLLYGDLTLGRAFRTRDGELRSAIYLADHRRVLAGADEVLVAQFVAGAAFALLDFVEATAGVQLDMAARVQHLLQLGLARFTPNTDFTLELGVPGPDGLRKYNASRSSGHVELSLSA